MEVRRGYNQTEVGEIPDDWKLKKIYELIEPSRGIRYGIVQPGRFCPNGCLMLKSQDYSKGWTNQDEMHRVNAQLENQYRNARIHSGDIIMTIVGAGIVQVAIAPEWLDGAILSRSTARIAVNNKEGARYFVAAYLRQIRLLYLRGYIIWCESENETCNHIADMGVVEFDQSDYRHGCHPEGGDQGHV